MLRGALSSLLFLALAVAHPLAAVAQSDTPAPGSSIAILPLRSRGLQPGEQRRIQQKVVSGARGGRVEVVAPEELLARLGTRRAPIDEARRHTDDGVARYRKLDRAGARERFDRAVNLYRASFGEWVDPAGFGNALLWRGAEKLSAGDATGSAADFFLAVTIAPDGAPTLDEFPPAVVEAWEAARLERARRPLADPDPSDLADVLGALDVSALATSHAERVEQSVALELSLWTAAAGSTPARTARVPLAALQEGDLERVSAASTSLASSMRPAALVVTRPPVEIPRADPNRTRTTVPRRPPRDDPRDRRHRGGLWSSPWLWAGIGGIALAGAGAGYLSTQDRAEPREDFKVILVPPES